MPNLHKAAVTPLDILPVVNRRALPKLDGYEVVYVGRPSAFGNPFPVDAHRSRRQAIAEFDAWLAARLQHATTQRTRVLHLANELVFGRRIALSCWCAPDPCHATVVRRVVLQQAVQILDALPPDARGPQEASLREALKKLSQ